MRKRFARILCGSLSVMLFCGQGMAYAGTAPAENETGKGRFFMLPNAKNTESKAEYGCIGVNLVIPQDIDLQQEFQVSLNGEQVKKVTLDSGNGQRNETVLFENLAPGNYTVEIQASGYLPYIQKIEVESYNYKIAVAPNDENEKEESTMGNMLYGNFDGDHAISSKDASALIDMLESGVYQKKYDMNYDGKLDLADLQLVSQKIGMTNRTSTVEKTISKDAVSGSTGDGTVLGDGQDVTDVLNGKSIQASPADGKAIAESPVELNFDFKDADVEIEGMYLQTPGDNAIAEGTILVTYEEDGELKTMEVALYSSEAKARMRAAGMVAYVNPDGTVSIEFGKQIAVKKVVLTITATTRPDASLVEISKVEFLNSMEDKIPAPQISVPELTTVKAGNKSISVAWNKVNNVTGYEVSIYHDGKTEYIRTSDTALAITQFLNKELENKEDYTVCVQAVNGEWTSGFSESQTVTPKADKKPDAPDALTLKSEYKSITASWKAPEDNAADTYTIYYKKKTDTAWQSVKNITATSYEIDALEKDIEYQFYVTASNEYGEGPASLTASGKTISVVAAQMNEYRLINKSNGEGKLSAHIKDAVIGIGMMTDSKLDVSGQSALGLFDNDYTSYWDGGSWDTGGYNQNQARAVKVTFDQTYTIGEIQFAEQKNITNYPYIRVYYQDENGVAQVQTCHWTSLTKTDENGRNYYRLKLSEPITVSSLSIGFGRYLASSPNVSLAEIRFYEYDSLSDDIQNLYTDDLHLAIRDDVTGETLDALQTRLDTKVDNEYHPDREVLQTELDAARQLYEDEAQLDDVLQISSQISAAYDSSLKTSGLNAWQPLGVSAKAGDTVVIYVGKTGAQTGSNTSLQLVATQQHAESSAAGKTIANLKVGRNEITIPELISTDVEKGGALYIQYTGNNKEDSYAVRVNGGRKIPVLNLYQVNNEAERKEKIASYVKELNDYVNALEAEDFKKTEKQLSVYNTTDILIDDMMFSLPASQVLAGLGSENREETLSDTLASMEDVMTLFYQNKGLTNSFAEGTDTFTIEKNHLPSQHLNIRYMKMFSGAFMYAAGNHIGIEWDQTKGLIQNGKTVVNENGQLTSGYFFGWGICHEIGHQLNQGEYAIAEVTNNYFAQLAKSDGTNASARWKYEDVYKKVTSGAVGYPSDGAVQLAMYWQLHLAYDTGYAQKTYDNYDEIFDNLFFARVDSYARNTSLFEGSVALQLTDSVDQNLMRLASAAAGKDLSEFFERWGYEPDAETLAFMGQFEKETRAIYYIDDDSKSADIENQAVSLENKEVLENLEVSVNHSDVTLTMQPSQEVEDQILGYEIIRVTTRKGKTEKEIVGFTTENTYTDTVNLGSRAVSYEIYPVDLQTNRAAKADTQTVKVISDGSYEKDQFTVSTNMTSAQDSREDADDSLPCESVEKPAVSMILDEDKSAEYTGSAMGTPYLLIDMKQQKEVSAIRYYADALPMSEYLIEVSKDGINYETVAQGSFVLEDGQETIYFNDGENPWVATYEARYIRITAPEQENKEISIAEIDILGPSGDNVEFATADGSPAIGYLEQDYIYQEKTDTQEELKIPAGSLVFMGTYKGNPAYNVVTLYDENGAIVGGINEEGDVVSNQIILAEVPDDAMLGEVSEGTWIYWIEPDELKKLPAKVRAELYRVDNALTNEGERLVSDTVFTELERELPYIRLGE